MVEAKWRQVVLKIKIQEKGAATYFSNGPVLLCKGKFARAPCTSGMELALEADASLTPDMANSETQENSLWINFLTYNLIAELYDAGAGAVTLVKRHLGPYLAFKHRAVSNCLQGGDVHELALGVFQSSGMDNACSPMNAY
eukprot:scaffold67648_cov17-Tisochrysis_lutea.AAC.1